MAKRVPIPSIQFFEQEKQNKDPFLDNAWEESKNGEKNKEPLFI